MRSDFGVLMDLLSQPDTYISFFTLLLMEVVLGIDNIVFITILAAKLPPDEQRKARRIGVAVALISRLALLGALSWVIGLKEVLFTVFEHPFSGRDLILLGGGLFLVGKATHEIYENVERPQEHQPQGLDESGALGAPGDTRVSMVSIVIQILILDVVFSMDSVITAVGMVDEISIMVAAMLGAVLIMLIFIGPIGDFVQKHASVRVLALSFLVLIGAMLVADGMGEHVPKGYIYFAMGFSLSIELINLRMKSRATRLRGEASGKKV
jgi:predicted tellurium resistance membrane protein TerC